MTEVEKLQNIKDTIEKMNKLQQIEVLKLLLEADIETSENGNGTFRIIDTTNSTDRLNILSSGNVGIGTTTPDNKLDVNGNMRTTDKNIITNGCIIECKYDLG